jgi:hypothetical protein
MFNLIVSGGGWERHRDSFGSGRVLEYTDAAIAQRFMPNNILDINAVAKLPTLFMSETQGAGKSPSLVQLSARMARWMKAVKDPVMSSWRFCYRTKGRR